MERLSCIRLIEMYRKSTIKAAKGKKDKKKPKKGGFDADLDGEQPDEEAANSKKAVEVTAEDLADEEWGPVKGKKGKKGKGKKGKNEDAEDEAAQGTAVHLTI